MEQTSLEIFIFLIGSVLLIQVMYSINHQFGADANQSKLEKRMVDLEANNRQQERDFSILKTRDFSYYGKKCLRY